MILVSVRPGQEVVSTLKAELRARGVTDGAVVSLIGAVEGCCISTMAADDHAKDILTEYAEPFELSGTGEIKDGTVHLHVVLGGEGDEAKAGHLHWAKVEHFFVNAYIVPLEG
ncbi:DNA-binding protein [Micromonospora sp. NBC_01699]|uniref:PPC domain-containing DNA-binding protein n=1 Tax=Micromonospora sp. NBC_01699 TaxID=2975984 RepID=UPI002E2C0DF9|nr:PPC domain-containing DNA-binding protein [Micromonospora sp. NBC_01699]